MRIPNFSAEASLYTSSVNYLATTSCKTTHAVLPQGLLARETLTGVQRLGLLGEARNLCISLCGTRVVVCIGACGITTGCIINCLEGFKSCLRVCSFIPFFL